MQTVLVRHCACPHLNDRDFREHVRNGAITAALLHLRTGVGCEACQDGIDERIRSVNEAIPFA